MAGETSPTVGTTTVWQANTLRLTAFLSPRAKIERDDWWMELVGQPPEKEVVLPRQGAHQFEGPFGEGRLGLTIRFNRIDWIWTANPLEDVEDEGRPTLGGFEQTLKLFQPMMERWLQKAPPIQRLAIGAILNSPVLSRVEGYKRLEPLLESSIRLNPEKSSDFLYQINRPRPSRRIEGLNINRLSKWSVESWKYMALSDKDVHEGREFFSSRVELDINTSADFQGEFPTDKLPLIFNELIDLGKEIGERGDIE